MTSPSHVEAVGRRSNSIWAALLLAFSFVAADLTGGAAAEEANAPPPPVAAQTPATPETASKPAASAPAAETPLAPASAPLAPMSLTPKVQNPPLPRELSPVGMFMSADIVVKAVMIGLLLASIATWSTWLAKTVELWSCRRSLKSALSLLASERSLAGASAHLADQSHVVAALVSAAATELKLSNDIVERNGIKDRISSRLTEIVAVTARRARVGTGPLASIGATAPFIGLFGTVWGIMNSFIGISKAQTTNLAVVAPGIAEALLATAIGLIAAIPAVLFYNQLSRSIATYKTMVGQASAEVERLVSRDLDRSASRAPHLRTAFAAE